MLLKLENKKCIKCFEIKTIDEFSYRNDIKQYNNTCKECKKNISKKHYENNKNSEYRLKIKSPEGLAKRREYYYKNHDRELIKSREWRLNNSNKEKQYREKAKPYQKEWRKNNIDYIKEYTKNYYLENEKYLKEYHSKYIKEYNIKNGISTGSGQTIPEKHIEQFLIENCIKYESEKSFDKCRNNNNNVLFFDFWLPDLNLLIEFDGIFHYEPIFGEEQLIKQQNNDKIKNEYCKQNNIKLIRISYFEQENIQQILIEKVNTN